MLLDGLGTHFPSDDLPAVLTWASAHVQDGEDAYGRLLPQLVAQGWAHAGSPAVCAALARLVAALARNPAVSGWARRNKPPWADGKPGQRRKLAVGVAEHVSAQGWYGLFDLRLVTPEDLGWLLDKLPTLPAPAQEALAPCIPRLVHHPTADAADLILGMPEGHPAYAHTQWLRQPLSIGSDAAKQWRELRERAAKDQDLRAVSRAERNVQLAAALNDANKDPARWWRVAFWLSVDDRDHAAEDLFTHDLTTRPGWSLLDDRERRHVLDLGVRYLATHQIEPPVWMGRKTVSMNQVLPDWSGVYLLTTLARHDPGRLQILEPSVWRRWAPAIVGAWTSGEDEDQRLRCNLVDLAPQDERRSMLDAALDQLDALQAHGGHLSPHQLYEHLCPGLAPKLAERLIAGSYGGELARTLLNLLVKRAPQVALATCQQLCAGPTSDLAAPARLGLAELDPSTIVDDLEASEATSADLIDVAPHLNLSGLDEAHLATLGCLLLHRFAFADDQPIPSGAFRPDTQYQVRRIRNLVLDQLAGLGQTHYLEELAQQCHDSEQKIIAWYLRQTRTRAADLAFTRPDPGKLLQLLSRADARLVRHGRDLLDVALNWLEQLQHELTNKGASRFLWNFNRDGDAPKSEDDISDWVRDQLSLRLTQASIIDREVQVARRRQGIGTRIDLTATTPTATQPPDSARVIAEAKLVTNATLMTAMHDQLVQRYLVPAGLQYGIYLVYWISPSQRYAGRSPKGTTDQAELMQQLKQQATAAAGQGLQIQPFLLDTSHP